MSDELLRLPPNVQERLLTVATASADPAVDFSSEKEQFQTWRNPRLSRPSCCRRPLTTAVIYKAVGSLLVKAEKPKVTEELVERKKVLGHKKYSSNAAGRAHAEPNKRGTVKAPRRPQPSFSAANFLGECPLVELGIPRAIDRANRNFMPRQQRTPRASTFSPMFLLKWLIELDISVEAEGSKPVNLSVELTLFVGAIGAKDVDVAGAGQRAAT